MLSEEYLGHTIVYSEETNRWYTDNHEITGPSLKAVKAKIQAIDAEERRIGVLPVFHVGLWRQVKPALATLLTDDRKGVWINIKASGNREKVKITEIVADTPENRAAIENANALTAKAEALGKQAAALLEALPRMTAEELLAREKV